jgi:hypothetical protein
VRSVLARLNRFIHEMQILFSLDDSVKYSWLFTDKFSPTFASTPCAQGTSDFSGVAIVAANGHHLSIERAAADALLPLDEKTKGHGKDSHGPWTLTRIEDCVNTTRGIKPRDTTKTTRLHQNLRLMSSYSCKRLATRA